VHYLGYVTRQELAALYRGAKIFVFPSAYEGFGYPVIEAMSYGAPVVSSNAFSLSEVVGDGGVLVAPTASGLLASTLSQILRSPKLRRELIVRGKKRASELKWERTSQLTLAVLQQVTAL
jgi:alpha-1,3-rhamnosyl/mannosyltransferase